MAKEYSSYRKSMAHIEKHGSYRKSMVHIEKHGSYGNGNAAY
jgi:hypothetical protein